MIINFRHDGLEKLFHDGLSKIIDKKLHTNCILILDLLNSATDVKDLAGIKNFHALKGDRDGQYAMSVNRNWRITFRFQKPDIIDVNFEDYH